MTWSYDNTLPTDKDKVRFRVQDTDTGDQLFQDEEIAYMLTEYPRVIAAAAKLARVLQSKFSRAADASVGQVSESASQRAAQYKDLADSLESEAGIYSLPSMGGESLAEKQALNSNSDGVQPAFKRRQFDTPNATQFDDIDPTSDQEELL